MRCGDRRGVEEAHTDSGTWLVVSGWLRCGALAGGFVEEERAGDGGVEAFDAAGRGDGDAARRPERGGPQRGRRLRCRSSGHRVGRGWRAATGMGLRVSVGSDPGATAARRRRPRDLSVASLRASTATTGTRKTEPAEARRAFWFHSLTVPAVVRTAVAPKASAERMSVPRLPGSCRAAAMSRSGVLCAGASCGERGFEVPDGRDEQRGDALRVLRVDRAGEGVVGEVEEFDSAREPCGGIDALAEEDGLDGEAAAQRFLEQMFAFDSDQAAGEPGVSRKRGAKLLDAWVGAAGDEDRAQA